MAVAPGPVGLHGRSRLPLASTHLDVAVHQVLPMQKRQPLQHAARDAAQHRLGDGADLVGGRGGGGHDAPLAGRWPGCYCTGCQRRKLPLQVPEHCSALTSKAHVAQRGAVIRSTPCAARLPAIPRPCTPGQWRSGARGRGRRAQHAERLAGCKRCQGHSLQQDTRAWRRCEAPAARMRPSLCGPPASAHQSAVGHVVRAVEIDEPRHVGGVAQRLDVVHHLLPRLLRTWGCRGVAQHAARAAPAPRARGSIAAAMCGRASQPMPPPPFAEC